VQKFVDTPWSTIGSVGKSVHFQPGPMHGVMVTWPPEPGFTPPPPLPPPPDDSFLTPAQPNALTTKKRALTQVATTVEENLLPECIT
jgi:hypothetical protein